MVQIKKNSGKGLLSPDSINQLTLHSFGPICKALKSSALLIDNKQVLNENFLASITSKLFNHYQVRITASFSIIWYSLPNFFHWRQTTVNLPRSRDQSLSRRPNCSSTLMLMARCLLFFQLCWLGLRFGNCHPSSNFSTTQLPSCSPSCTKLTRT